MILLRFVGIYLQRPMKGSPTIQGSHETLEIKFHDFPWLNSQFSMTFSTVKIRTIFHYWTILGTAISMTKSLMKIGVKLAISDDHFRGRDSCKIFTRNSSQDNFGNYHISYYILNANKCKMFIFPCFWNFSCFPWLSMTANFSMTFPDFPWLWEPWGSLAIRGLLVSDCCTF